MVFHRVTNAVIGGAGMIGYAFAFTADFNKAVIAAGRVCQFLDRKPLMDKSDSFGKTLSKIDGNIDIINGKFSYPTR